MDLFGKTALVTGASRGIGKAIQTTLSAAGAVVYTTSKSHQDHDTHMQVDFTNSSSRENFYSKIKDLKFDICVNNAGVNKIKSFDGFTPEEYDHIMDVNIKSPFRINQIVGKSMSDNGGGKIINIASIYGVVSKPQRLLYTMSKSSLIGMTKTLAVELAHKNVLVNCVSPGFTLTDLTREVLGDSGIEQTQNKIPMGRLANPKEIANTVLFLCSDLNTYITGQNIIIDGGYVSGEK